MFVAMNLPGSLAVVAALSISSAAAVPLPLGESWDGGGIGGALLAGPVWKSTEGFAPNHLGGHFWYHYRPDLVASMGIEMSDWNNSRTQSLFQTQYVGCLSWIPWGGSDELLEVGLRAGGERSLTTLDTGSRGADPLVDDSWDWQLGLRVGSGWRRGIWGFWASTGPIACWRASGSASGWNMVQESEVGFQVSFQGFWNSSASYTRAWNLAVRIPVIYEPRAPRFTRQGATYRSQWTFGVVLGPSVLF